MENTKNNNQSSVQSIVQIALVLLLVVAAFFIGMLWTKVQTLEGGSGNANNAANNNNLEAPSAAGNGAPQVGDVDPISDADHVKGNKDAKIVMIEYSDYECPFCRRYHPTAQQLMDEYEGKILWAYRQFPLESIHPNARPWAIAGECAAKVGGDEGFWKFTDAIFGVEPADVDVYKLASQVGLNAASFKLCVDNKETDDAVSAGLESGQRAGITGTPGTIIWNLESDKKELVPGAVPYSMLKQIYERVANE